MNVTTPPPCTGIYLPLLWEPEFCCKSPLCLGYTRGHFSALVPLEPYPHRHSYICRYLIYLILVSADRGCLQNEYCTLCVCVAGSSRRRARR